MGALRRIFSRNDSHEEQREQEPPAGIEHRQTLPAHVATVFEERKFWQRWHNTEDLDKQQKFWDIYDEGGVVSEAFDSFWLFITAKGYRIEASTTQREDEVNAWCEQVDILRIIENIQLHEDILGFSVSEKLWGRGASRGVLVGLLTGTECPSWTMRPIYDTLGNLLAVEQYKRGVGGQWKVHATLQPNDVLVTRGTSLMKRAYDDILRDTQIAEATALMIRKHGYGRYHVRIGASGEIIPESVIADQGRQFQRLAPGMEVATSHDVEVKNIDEAGIPHAESYQTMTLTRLAASLGVPEEMLGLGRGSTEATAKVKRDAFLLKAQSRQRSKSRFITQLLRERFGPDVTFKLNDIDPEDEMTIIEGVTKLVRAVPTDPWSIISPDWARKRLGIEGED